MPESFGARLRRQREERQIDLIAIAEQTKIKLALLEALERDDVSRWPAGIFRRAYIRTYAQFIGLDPDAILRDFLETHPDPADVFSTLGAVGEVTDETARRPGAPPTRLRHMVDSAIGSLSRLRRPPAGEGQPALSPPAPATRVAAEMDADPAYGEVPDIRAESVVLPAGLPPEFHRIEDPVVSFEEAPAAFEPALPLSPGGPEAETVEAFRESPATLGGRQPDAGDADRDAEMRVQEILRETEATLEAVAYLSTELGRASDRIEVQHLLHESAAALKAAGLILWLWDQSTEQLTVALAHGYSKNVLAQIPAVGREAENATAASFRSASICEVTAAPDASAALVVPLLMPDGCAGVLAIELRPGIVPTASIRAIAAVIAAALAQLVRRVRQAGVTAPAERPASPLSRPRPVIRPAIRR